MRTLLIAVLFLFGCATVAVNSRTATYEAYAGTVTLTIMDSPCSDDAVLAQIPSELHEDFQNARIEVAGIKLSACWSATVSNAPMEDNYIFIIDENGMTGRVSLENFAEQKPKGVSI